MRRSFAEFHVQRRQPELAAVLAAGQEALRKLDAAPWPQSPLGTSREEVERYYELSEEIERLDGVIQAEARRGWECGVCSVLV